MKKIILLLIIFTFSCSSFDALVVSSIKGQPIWIYDKSVEEGQLSFVSKTRVLHDQRKLNEESAIDDLIKEIEKEIPLSIEQKRELHRSRAIEDLSLNVVDEYFEVVNNDFDLDIYLFAIADREKREYGSQEKLLLEKAKKAYRDLKDTQSAQMYIDLGLSTKKEEYYDKALNIINKLDLNIDNDKVITLKRISWIDRPISAAMIKIKTLVNSINNEIYDYYVSLATDKDGKINFFFINDMELKHGNIEVFLDLDISKIEDKEIYKKLNKALKAKSKKIEYTKKDISISYAVKDYDLKGNQYKNSLSIVGFLDSAKVMMIDVQDVNSDYILKGEIRLEKVQRRTEGEYLIVVRGSAQVYNKEGKMVYNSEEFETITIDSDQQKGISDAFKTFAKMLFISINSYL